MAYVNFRCHTEARSKQNTFLPGRDQLTARWTCACGDGEVSHTHTHHCGVVGVQPDLKLSPQSEQPSIKLSQHCPLIYWHFCLLQIARTWYRWLHVISGIVLYSICSPPSVKYNAFNSPAFCLGYFFHLQQRKRTVCLLVLAKGQRLFSDIIPTIDQTLFTLTWFLFPPAIRRQPSTSCTTDQLYTFIFPVSGNISCCG